MRPVPSGGGGYQSLHDVSADETHSRHASAELHIADDWPDRPLSAQTSHHPR
jgi:hypothetical protein